jgi:hypothetical protein
MQKTPIPLILAGGLLLIIACAAPLHQYHVPTSLPDLVLIDDQVFDLRSSLPIQASLAEVHLRDGTKLQGRFLSFDEEQIEISPGYQLKEVEGAIEKVEHRRVVDKRKILLLKIW